MNPWLTAFGASGSAQSPRPCQRAGSQVLAAIYCQAELCLPEAVVYVLALLSIRNLSSAEQIVLKGMQPLLCNLCPHLTTRAPDFTLRCRPCESCDAEGFCSKQMPRHASSLTSRQMSAGQQQCHQQGVPSSFKPSS